MSRTTKATVLVAVVMLVITSGAAAAVSPSDSVPARFDSSTTDAKTVVVAVGSPDTAEGRAALTAANSIAAKENYTVVRTPADRIPISLVETLTQRVKHGELRNAIVVGVNESKTDAIAAAVGSIGADVGGREVTIDVKDIVTAKSGPAVLRKAALQTWDSANSMLLTTTAGDDTEKASLVVSDEAGSGWPVLAAGSGYDDINATADLLGVSTVYVTPGVSQDLRDKLANNGYTVKTKVDSTSLDQSLQEVSVGLAENKTEDVAVVGVESHVYYASQFGSGANSSVLVTRSSDRIGSHTDTQISNLNGTSTILVMGNDDDVADAVMSDVSSAAPSSTNVTRITRTQSPRQLYLRTSLIVSDYRYGVMVSYVTSGEEQATVTVTNVGFSTVSEVSKVGPVENSSVALRWSGAADSVQSSSPSGISTNGDYVVGISGDMAPGENQNVTLTADSLPNGGHPTMNYYVGSSGALIGTTSGLGFFIEHIANLAAWLQDMVATVLSLGPLSISPTNPLVIGVVLVLVGVSVYGGWKLLQKGFERRR